MEPFRHFPAEQHSFSQALSCGVTAELRRVLYLIYMSRKRYSWTFSALLFFLFFFTVTPFVLHADDVSDLKQKIDERNQLIKELEADIAKYQTIGDQGR